MNPLSALASFYPYQNLEIAFSGPSFALEQKDATLKGGPCANQTLNSLHLVQKPSFLHWKLAFLKAGFLGPQAGQDQLHYWYQAVFWNPLTSNQACQQKLTSGILLQLVFDHSLKLVFSLHGCQELVCQCCSKVVCFLVVCFFVVIELTVTLQHQKKTCISPQ